MRRRAIGAAPEPTKAGATPASAPAPSRPAADSFVCPYCSSEDFVKRGTRAKKHERVQLYLCKACRKTFTPHLTKGKHYPLAVMLDAISIYNLGYSLEETCRIVNFRVNRKATSSEVALNGTVDSRTSDTKVSLPSMNSVVNSGGESENRTLSPKGRTVYRTASATMPTDSPTKTSIKNKIMQIQSSTISTWIAETEFLCRYCQMRPYIMQKYRPKDVVIHATLAHRQLYRYRFHRGKCQLLINHEYRHRKFQSLAEFLELVPSDCPHQYFSAEGKEAEESRASKTPLAFSKTAMIVRGKTNFATQLAKFVLQSVRNRRLRHEAIQKFMLANDSVTVATEVPVYITRDDLEHMKTQLGFQIYSRVMARNEAAKLEERRREAKPTAGGADSAEIAELPKLITGHIDILQIRNGQIHILDYKPQAAKEQPIEQLTLYAMALSRLTGLRLFEFKCAWFDEKDYFEFYPLHVLHKPKKARRRRKIATQEGVYMVNKNEKKILNIKPITNC